MQRTTLLVKPPRYPGVVTRRRRHPSPPPSEPCRCLFSISNRVVLSDALECDIERAATTPSPLGSSGFSSPPPPPLAVDTNAIFRTVPDGLFDHETAVGGDTLTGPLSPNNRAKRSSARLSKDAARALRYPPLRQCQMHELVDALPPRCADLPWSPVFDTDHDGFSMAQMYRRCEDVRGAGAGVLLLVVADREEFESWHHHHHQTQQDSSSTASVGIPSRPPPATRVIGAFLSHLPTLSWGRKYYGSKDCLVFAFDDKDDAACDKRRPRPHCGLRVHYHAAHVAHVRSLRDLLARQQLAAASADGEEPPEETVAPLVSVSDPSLLPYIDESRCRTQRRGASLAPVDASKMPEETLFASLQGFMVGMGTVRGTVAAASSDAERYLSHADDATGDPMHEGGGGPALFIHPNLQFGSTSRTCPSFAHCRSLLPEATATRSRLLQQDFAIFRLQVFSLEAETSRGSTLAQLVSNPTVLSDAEAAFCLNLHSDDDDNDDDLAGPRFDAAAHPTPGCKCLNEWSSLPLESRHTGGGRPDDAAAATDVVVVGGDRGPLHHALRSGARLVDEAERRDDYAHSMRDVAGDGASPAHHPDSHHECSFMLRAEAAQYERDQRTWHRRMVERARGRQ